MISAERAVLMLFKAYPLWDKDIADNSKFYSNETLIPYGLVFSEELKPIEAKVWAEVLDVYPRNKIANTFWSFKRTLDTEANGTRVFYQLIHYFSTYGLEAMGAEPTPYIPNLDYGKELEGMIKERLVIKAFGVNDLRKKALNLLNTNIGFSELQREAIIFLMKELLARKAVKPAEVVLGKNRDLVTALLNLLNIPIEDFELLLRIILGRQHLRKIKTRKGLNYLNNSPDAIADFERFIWNDADDKLLTSLAQTYHRNKEYALALKCNPYASTITKRFINKAKRLAKTYYQPVKEFHILKASYKEYRDLVKSLSLPTLVKHYSYFLKREFGIGLFFIRNGSLWLEKGWPEFVTVEGMGDRKVLLKNEIMSRVQEAFSGMVFNKDCLVGLPTSASNFVGNIPMFSRFTVDTSKDSQLAVGIHWFNLKDDRVDLDLHLYDATTNQQIGWNSIWVDDSTHIIFSGDMTDASYPYGAAEYMLIRNVNNFPKEQMPKALFKVFDFIKNVYSLDDYFFSLVVLTGDDLDDKESLLQKIKGGNVKFTVPVKFNKAKPSISLGIWSNRSFYFIPLSLEDRRIPTKNNILSSITEKLELLAKHWPTVQDFGCETSENEGIKFQDLTINMFDKYWKI